MVVKSKGNGTPYFREIQVGEILFHLARYMIYIYIHIYLLSIGDDTTQLYRDYNKPLQGSPINQAVYWNVISQMLHGTGLCTCMKGEQWLTRTRGNVCK